MKATRSKIIPKPGLLMLLFAVCMAFAQTAAAQESWVPAVSDITLLKPSEGPFGGSYSAVQHQTVSQRLKQPLRVRVLRDEQTPVAGIPVSFSVIKSPNGSNGFVLEDEVVLSDARGYAETNITLGSKPGLYEVAARIHNESGAGDIQYFRIQARRGNWVLFLVIGLAGGLGLFLYGMNLMSGGMRKTAGGKLRSILSTLTTNRFMAVGVGAFVTMVIQSSSATTVMLVSFVQAQLMSFSQSLGIILGADIGTTITAQLIAFKLTDYALVFVAAGFLLMVMSSSTKNKNIGETIMGFGLLFYGMKIMSDAMYPLRTYEPFLALLLKLEFPIFGILIGGLFTALIQSSSAFTGIIIILASQGLLTLEAAIPLLFGANLGTCVTAGLASINTNREARRVAMAHTLFKVFGIVLFFWWIPYFADIVRWISPKGAGDVEGAALLANVVPRQVANAHTIFNVALTVLALPFTNQVARLITGLLPDEPYAVEEGPCKAKYLNEDMITTSDVALSLAKVEVLRVGDKVKQMVQLAIEPFQTQSDETLEKIAILEAEVDHLEELIKEYVTKIIQQSVPKERVDEAYQILHTITELEQIGDIVSKNITELAIKHQESRAQFSDQGNAEIMGYHLKTAKQLSRAMNVFKEVNLEKALKMEAKYQKYRLMEMGLRRTHFERLRDNVPGSIESSEIHMTLMDYLKRMSSHATNIARILLETKNAQAAGKLRGKELHDRRTPCVPKRTGDLTMRLPSRMLILMTALLLAACNSTGDQAGKTELPLGEHEHKLMLNPEKFADLEEGFEGSWELVKSTAAANGVQVQEYVEDYERSRYDAAFYDTEDLQLSKKGYLIRRRTKVKDGQRDDEFKLTLKFKTTDHAEAAAADVSLSKAYDPEQEDLEVEADVVNGPRPDSEPSTFFTVKKSIKLEQVPGDTVADYTSIFPVLGTLGVDPATKLVPVNGIEIDVHVVTPGRLDFGNDLSGEVDISVWMIDGKVISEFSFDHSLESWESVPSSSVDSCENFVGLVQKAAPDWWVDGRLKATFVYEK